VRNFKINGSNATPPSIILNGCEVKGDSHIVLRDGVITVDGQTYGAYHVETSWFVLVGGHAQFLGQ